MNEPVSCDENRAPPPLVRRKFVDEVERAGSPIAQQAIKQIAQLYAVEKEARGKSPQERVTLRQAKAKPVFDALEIWLQAQLRKISGKTKLDLDVYPYLPKANVGTTSAASYMSLMQGQSA